MGFKEVEKVYGLSRDLTTSAEQAVLLALAFRLDDNKHLCYPKQETLAKMTHLRRSTVARALNSLRAKGLIQWKSGGLANKKGKYGKTLSNDYTLTLPPQTAGEGKKKGQPSVRPSDTPVSDHRTHQCPTIGHTSVRPSDTAVSDSRTPTEINNSHHNNDTIIRTPVTASGFDGLTKELGSNLSADRPTQPKVDIESSPLHMALAICKLTPKTTEYRDNYRAFSKVMMEIGMERSMEIVRTIASAQRQGELDIIDSLPRLIMSRLKKAYNPT